MGCGWPKNRAIGSNLAALGTKSSVYSTFRYPFKTFNIFVHQSLSYECDSVIFYNSRANLYNKCFFQNFYLLENLEVTKKSRVIVLSPRTKTQFFSDTEIFFKNTEKNFQEKSRTTKNWRPSAFNPVFP